MVSNIPPSRSVVVKSIPSAIDGLYEWILNILEANGFSTKDIFAVHLALEEAFLNAIKHGNKMDSSKDVKIDCSVTPDRIDIFMTDEGGGFDPNTVPDPRCSENLYKTGGRGLFLMRSYLDVVEFNERGNCVHMARYKRKRNIKSVKSR